MPAVLLQTNLRRPSHTLVPAGLGFYTSGPGFIASIMLELPDARCAIPCDLPSRTRIGLL